MLEGDSSEQQLIVILSRMRGWDFIAWSFRGVWDSSWEEKVIPFLRESAFWESGLHSFISIEGVMGIRMQQVMLRSMNEFSCTWVRYHEDFFAWFAHWLCMHLNIGIGSLILICSPKEPSPPSFSLVAFWFYCFLLVCCLCASISFASMQPADRRCSTWPTMKLYTSLNPESRLPCFFSFLSRDSQGIDLGIFIRCCV